MYYYVHSKKCVLKKSNLRYEILCSPMYKGGLLRSEDHQISF